MPLYEYECQQCHRHTEKRQKFSDAEITGCPHCGGSLKRVISAPAISFKGGGWYADGYGNAKPKSSGDGTPSKDAKPESAPSDPGAKSSGDTAPTSAPATPAAPAGTNSPAPPAAKS